MNDIMYCILIFMNNYVYFIYTLNIKYINILNNIGNVLYFCIF